MASCQPVYRPQMLNPDNTDEHRSKALGIKSRKIGSIGVDRCSALDWAPPMQPISAQVDDYFAWGQTLRPMILLSEIRPEGVFSMKLTSIAILIVRSEERRVGKE